MGLYAGAVKQARNKKRSKRIAEQTGSPYILLGDIVDNGRVEPTSNNSGRKLYDDGFYDYAQVGVRAVSAGGFKGGNRGGVKYEPILKRVGRKPGSSAHSDVQPVKAKRGKDPRSSSKRTTQKGENRRASTILTGAQGLLGGGSTSTKTLLGK